MNAEEAFKELEQYEQARLIMKKVIDGSISYEDLACIYGMGYNAAKPEYISPDSATSKSTVILIKQLKVVKEMIKTENKQIGATIIDEAINRIDKVIYDYR